MLVEVVNEGGIKGFPSPALFIGTGSLGTALGG
jgi:hypothetical protein